MKFVVEISLWLCIIHASSKFQHIFSTRWGIKFSSAKIRYQKNSFGELSKCSYTPPSLGRFCGTSRVDTHRSTLYLTDTRCWLQIVEGHINDLLDCGLIGITWKVLMYHCVTSYVSISVINTLRPRQLDAISQTTYSNAFSWMKMFEYRLKFHWRLFLRAN